MTLIVLSRLLNEQVVINDQILLTVVEIMDDKARLAVTPLAKGSLKGIKFVAASKRKRSPFGWSYELPVDHTLEYTDPAFGMQIEGLGGPADIRLVDVRMLSESNAKVRVGFKLPITVPLHRKEVFDAILCERARAQKLT